jgi:ATP-binding cassette, subfamily B, bacterial PglK
VFQTIVKSILILIEKSELNESLVVLSLAIILSLVEALGIISIMPFLTVLADPNLTNSNTTLLYLFKLSKSFGINTTNEFIFFLGLVSFSIIIFAAAFRTITHYKLSKYIEMRRHFLGLRLLKAYVRQPYYKIMNRHTSEMNKAILSEVDQLIAYVVRPVVNLISNSFVVLILIIMLVVVKPILAFFLICILGGMFLFAYTILRKKLKRLGEKLLFANTQRFKAASNVLDGLKDVKILGVEELYIQRFEKPSLSFAKAYTSNVVLEQLPKYFIEAIAFGGLIAIVLISMTVSQTSEIQLVNDLLPIIGLYAFTAYRLQPAMQSIYSSLSNLTFGNKVLQTLSLDLVSMDDKIRLLPSRGERLLFEEMLHLENVTFQYPGMRSPVLKDVSVSIPKGKKVAIIGKTGSGKSTLVDLILGLLEPSEGSIRIDTITLDESNKRLWRNSIGYLPQEVFFLDATIAENIAFGFDVEDIDYHKVKKCASLAKINDYIEKSLPKQYNSLIGQRGSKLSGGQKQRIGIARSLYRNPDIIILDEATSALDIQTEQKVINSIQSYMSNKTIFMIAHRLETIVQCDIILALENGQLTEIKDPNQIFSKIEK